MKKNTLFASLFIGAAYLISCDSSEIGESKDVNQDKIYMDYLISHNEGDEDVNITCQFRFAGNKGTTLVLSGESRVELDGEKLMVDSNEVEGAFYGITKPVSSFYGKHIISFTNSLGKKFENAFTFSPFAIKDPLAEISRKKGLRITYLSAPFTPADYTEVSSTDTDSSLHYYQNYPDTAIVIPAKDLQRQKVSSLSLDCRLFRGVNLQQSTPEGGQIRIRQNLKPLKIKLQP